MEIQRKQERDRKQTPASLVAAVVLRCYQFLEIALTPEESKVMLLYLGKYFQKNPLKLSNTLVLLQAAVESAQRFPSTADDAGTESRNAKFLLTKFINHLTSLLEISEQQAAALLLGNPSFYTNHDFWYCYPWNALQQRVQLGRTESAGSAGLSNSESTTDNSNSTSGDNDTLQLAPEAGT